MAFHNVENFSFGYFLLKAYNFLGNLVFYKKVVSFNKHNVPKDAAVIMAPNHQNALMDALAVVNNLKGSTVFLARSDIFRKKKIASILYFMKILPIYRIRDGASELQKNQKVFDKTVEILRKNKRLTLLPEGNHAGFRRLRPLQKGICRIAFQAEASTDFKLGIQIIPVGLDYSHYHKFRSDLFIHYGKPINVSDFYDSYKENPQKGMNELKMRIAEKLSKVMIDIQSEEYYESYLSLKDIYRDRLGDQLKMNSSNQPGKFICDKSMIAMLDAYAEKHPEGIKDLDIQVKKYVTGLKKLRLRDWLFKKESYSFLGLVFRSLLQLLFLPLHVYGIINNYLPYKIPVLLTRKVKDEQFLSSFRYVLGLITFLIFYLVFIILFCVFIKDPFIRLGYIISLPLSGLFAFSYFIHAKKLIARWRYSFSRGQLKTQIKALFKLRKEIRNSMDQVAGEVKPVLPDFN